MRLPVCVRLGAVIAIGLATGRPVAIGAPIVVENTNVRLLPDTSFPPANYVFRIGTPPFGDDGTSIWVQYDSDTIRIATALTDEQAEFFIVQPGDRLTRQAVLTNQFPHLSIGPPPAPPGGGLAFYEHNGNDFHLGISAPVRYLEQPGFPIQEFGWMHLQPDGNELKMLANVMSYNSPGIVIGTTTLVPESATWLLAAVGMSSAAIRARRKPTVY
jgi:hypothetical protein